MTALSRALQTYRPYEQDYIAELVSIRREIEFLLDFAQESASNRTLSPVVVDLLEREALIERVLRLPTLPPLPYELRNPFDRPPTPDKAEYIKKLMKKCGGKHSH